MWPDLVSNPGPLTYESGALPTALCGPALFQSSPKHLDRFYKKDLDFWGCFGKEKKNSPSYN